MTNTEKFKEVLKGIADNIRTARGTTDKIPFNQLVEQSAGLEVIPDTYILVDEDGNEVAAVALDERVELTADKDVDIRAGVTAITNDGVVTGTKEIPAYYVYAGHRLVTKGSQFVFPTPNYNYKKLQAIFCPYSTSLANSVSAEKVVIDDHVYNVSSNVSVASVKKDPDTTSVNFGITNESDSIFLIRYFMYTEVY